MLFFFLSRSLLLHFIPLFLLFHILLTEFLCR